MRRMVKRESTFSNWQVYGPITEALRDGQREHRANFLKQPGGGARFGEMLIGLAVPHSVIALG